MAGLVVVAACARGPTMRDAALLDAADSADARVTDADLATDGAAAVDAAPDVDAARAVDAGAEVATPSYVLEYRESRTRETSALAIADVTGDERADLISAGQPLLLYPQEANGKLGQAIVLGASSDALALVDVDVDGLLDIVFLKESGVGVLRSLGEGRFAPAITSPGPGGGGFLYPTDLNRDGHVDLLAHLHSLGVEPAVAYLGDGRGGLSPFSVLPAEEPPSSLRALSTGDVTGDGIDDLVVYREGQGGSLIAVHAHDGKRGYVEQAAEYPIGAMTAFERFLRVTDLDDDGRNEVLLYATVGIPGVIVFGRTSKGTLERRAAVTTGTTVDALVVLDVDRDGHSEVITLIDTQVIVYRRVPGSYRELTRARVPVTGSVQPIMAVGDLDSNGCADAVVVSVGQISLLYGVRCDAQGSN